MLSQLSINVHALKLIFEWRKFVTIVEYVKQSGSLLLDLVVLDLVQEWHYRAIHDFLFHDFFD